MTFDVAFDTLSVRFCAKAGKTHKEVIEMRKMLEYFKDMEDYRQARKVKHQLVDIIVIIICAVVSGAENIAEIALWAKCKEEWLRTILDLENGLPSQDTLERFMRYMNPKEFKRSFLHWVRCGA